MKNSRCAVAVMLPLLFACSAGDAQSKDKAIFNTDNPNIIKRSRDNVCHDRTSEHFARTVHFRAYRTMQDCIDSGGRRFKK